MFVSKAESTINSHRCTRFGNHLRVNNLRHPLRPSCRVAWAWDLFLSITFACEATIEAESHVVQEKGMEVVLRETGSD